MTRSTGPQTGNAARLPGTDETKAARMAEAVARARGRVCIFAGEASAPAYGDPAFLSATVDAYARSGTKLHVICGPILSVAERRGALYSGLLDLHDQGIATLYSRTQRTKTQHFLVTDEPSLILEDPHGLHAGQGGGNLVIPPDSEMRDMAWDYMARFNRMIRTRGVGGATIRRAKRPRRDFILLRTPQIATLVEATTASGIDLDLLDVEETRALCNSLGFSATETLFPGKGVHLPVAMRAADAVSTLMTDARPALRSGALLFLRLSVPIIVASQVVALTLAGDSPGARPLAIEVALLSAACGSWFVRQLLCERRKQL